ncbi:MAG: terminase family protein [Clostridia bacterium]|nr:terminase family protein [Clostridia bacterium]
MKANLTKAEVCERLNKLLKEKQRRLTDDKLSNYNTGQKVHQKQMLFHKCKKKNRWVFGGNRTGKTECGAVEALWLARGNHPFRENRKDTAGWVVSLSTQVQRDVAQKKILSYLPTSWIHDIVMLNGKKDSPSSGIIDQILIKNVFGGISTIGFKSVDQGREKFQGTSLDYVWFDEEPPFDIYFECKMRVLDRCGDIFGTMTPLKGLTWVYNIIYLNERNDPDIWYQNMSWKDNPYLNEQEVKKLSDTLSEDELNSRNHGNFSFKGGMVYSNFDENVNVIDPFNVPKEWYDNISIDPGYKNPLSCHWYAQDYDGNIYVIAEHYKAGITVEEHSNFIKEICKQLDWPMHNGYISALIDSAGLQKTLASSKSVVDMFYENGILTNPKVNKDLFTGIQKVKNYIKNSNGESRLFIFRNCTNLIREIKGYFWGSGENPIKDDDHCLDELRYYIMSKQPKSKPKEEVPLQVKFKNKLISNQRRLTKYG